MLPEQFHDTVWPADLDLKRELASCFILAMVLRSIRIR
jgi:hypothetical protein